MDVRQSIQSVRSKGRAALSGARDRGRDTRSRLGPLDRLRGRGIGAKAPWAVLSLMIATYIGAYSYWSLRNHFGFATHAFDLGIFDQGVWLLSRFDDPYVDRTLGESKHDLSTSGTPSPSC